MANGTGTYSCSASCCGGGTCPCCGTPPTFYVWSWSFGVPTNGSCTKCHNDTGVPATREGWARSAPHVLANTGTCTWDSTPEKAAGVTLNCSGTDMWIAARMVVTCASGLITHTLTLYVSSAATWPGFGSATGVASYTHTVGGSNCTISGASPVTMTGPGAGGGCTYPTSVSMFTV